jgi:hypothetical protein
MLTTSGAPIAHQLEPEKEIEPVNNKKEKTTRTTKASENPSTSPAHHPAYRQISIERAQELTGTLVDFEDDGRAAALVELLAGVAYAPDELRDGLAFHAITKAFTRTTTFASAETAFCQSI